jgi:predicted nucleic acid-binding protein
MQKPSCTIDSSCVIAIDFLNLLPNFTFLFSSVHVPKAVREDLFKRRDTKNRIQSLFRELGFLKRCDDYDKGAVEILLVERVREGTKDRGEVEAVVQASQLGATVIVDDPWGRELAARFELECHGTVWVLERFYRLELITSSHLRDCFAALRDRGTRLPWKTVNELLTEIGEAPL